jgi:hypothetical protein
MQMTRLPRDYCPVAADVYRHGNEPDPVSEDTRSSYAREVSEHLRTLRAWPPIEAHLAMNDGMWSALGAALCRVNMGDVTAHREIEDLIRKARESVADDIVERYFRINPYLPWPSAELLAKYPTGRIPQTEILADAQRRR